MIYLIAVSILILCFSSLKESRLLKKFIVAGIFCAFGIRAILLASSTILRIILIIFTLIMVKSIFVSEKER